MGLNSDTAVGFLDLGIMTVLPPGNHLGQCMFALIITVIAFATLSWRQVNFFIQKVVTLSFPVPFQFFFFLMFSWISLPLIKTGSLLCTGKTSSMALSTSDIHWAFIFSDGSDSQIGIQNSSKAVFVNHTR